MGELAPTYREETIRSISKSMSSASNERPLSDGLVRWLQSNQPESTLSYVRSTATEEILTVLNFSNRPVQLVLPHESIFDQILLCEGAKMQRAGEELAIDVQAEGYIVAKRTVGA